MLSPLSVQIAVLISIRSQPISPEPHGNYKDNWEHNYGPNPSLLHVYVYNNL